MKEILLAGAALALAVGPGCVTPPRTQAGAPIPLEVASDKNPDVIWIIRPVAAERSDGFHTESIVVFGLFECYRPKNPGPPEFFLAQTAGDKASLVWPDSAKAYSFGQAD